MADLENGEVLVIKYYNTDKGYGFFTQLDPETQDDNYQCVVDYGGDSSEPETRDVFFHINNFVRPRVVGDRVELRPLGARGNTRQPQINKGWRVRVTITTNEKGECAHQWCYDKEWQNCLKILQSLQSYRMLGRKQVPGKPKADNKEKKFVSDTQLVERIVWEGWNTNLGEAKEAKLNVQLDYAYNEELVFQCLQGDEWVDCPDPVAAWEKHMEELQAQRTGGAAAAG